MPFGSRLSVWGFASLQTNTPELPPASMCIHSMCRTKFSYWLVAPHDADGMACAHDHAVADGPGALVGVHIDPAAEIAAVEQIAEARGGGGRAGVLRKKGQRRGSQDAASSGHNSISLSSPLFTPEAPGADTGWR